MAVVLTPPWNVAVSPPQQPGSPPPASTELTVIANELDYGRDVLLSPLGYLTTVITLAFPVGKWIASATVAVMNRGLAPHNVDAWMGAYPAPLNFAGPRAAHVTVAPGASASLQLGPFVADIRPTPITASVICQRDNTAPDDQVWALADTTLATRGGATGVLGLGVAE